jgi:hypothetical protein
MFRAFRRIGSLLGITVLLFGLTQGASASADDEIVISGKVTDMYTGVPLVGACVELWKTALVASSCTDAAGRYAVAAVAGAYEVKATSAGYADMWAGETQYSGQPILYAASSTIDFVMVHEWPSATGLIVDPAGNPAPGATVRFKAVTGTYTASVLTGANGRFVIEKLPPIQMTISVSAAPGGEIYPTQWVPRRTTEAAAEIFKLRDGQDLSIYEPLLDHGWLSVRFSDKISNAWIDGACIRESETGKSACSVDGSARLTLPFGARQITFTTPEHYGPTPAPVTVDILPSQSTVLAYELAYSGTSITVDLRMPYSNLARPKTCVIAVPVRPGVFDSPGQTAYKPSCGGETGPFEVWLEQAVPVRLFAYVPSTGAAADMPQYGAHWVTDRGGVGDLDQALVINPVANTRIDGPEIRLEQMSPDFVLAGTVGGPIGGEYCVSVLALPLALPTEISDGQVRTCVTVAAGGSAPFALKGLGPHIWPLLFTSMNGGAYSWTGGGTNRLAADVSNMRSLFVQQMPGLGGTIRGTITGGSGGQMLAYDAVTGDFVAAGAVSGNSFTIAGLNTRPLALQYRPPVGTACWPAVPAPKPAPRTLPTYSWSSVVGQIVELSTVDVGSNCAADVRLIPERLPSNLLDGRKLP